MVLGYSPDGTNIYGTSGRAVSGDRVGVGC